MLPNARQEKLVIREVADELLVYDTARHDMHRLNRTTALVWRHCDGRTPLAELAAVLARELGLPADEQVALLALDQLDRAGLLRESLPRSATERRLTRRQAVALGFGSAMALLLPGCDSATAPSPVPQTLRASGGKGCDNSLFPECGLGQCGPGQQCENFPANSDNCQCRDIEPTPCRNLPNSRCDEGGCTDGRACIPGPKRTCQCDPPLCGETDDCSGTCSPGFRCGQIDGRCDCEECPVRRIGRDVGLFNTGVNARGERQLGRSREIHYTLTIGPDDTSALAFVTRRRSPSWSRSTTEARWIGPNFFVCSNNPAKCSDPPGRYLYKLEFTLPSDLDPNTAVVSGRVAADNELTILLNGQLTGFERGPEAFRRLEKFEIDEGFQEGRNTLLFRVRNLPADNGDNPSGLVVADLEGRARAIIC